MIAENGKRTGRILRLEILSVLLLILLILFLIIRQNSGTGTSSNTEITVYKTGYCFDTVVTLTAYTSREDSERAAQLLEDALLLCQEYEAKYLDRFDEESEIGAINAAQKQALTEEAGADGTHVSVQALTEEAGADGTHVNVQAQSGGSTADGAADRTVENKTSYSYELSDICRELVVTGLFYYHFSDGAFDLTIAPLSDLWNVTSEDFTVPTKERVEEAKTLVGSDRVTLTGNTLTLGEGQQLNFGGIAKGYMCEVLRQYFTENGLSHVIVNLGGNVFVMGGE
ncbi:MAG: FAD:protein FMN transferase, partial [Lachnospiraceae bacterium]|nr:FAD:protein FMN transferase [Lachnospiraceae bacterium]